jgi:hypothetical protein
LRPSFVVLHDIASHDGLDFLVMEHVAGQTLNELIPPDNVSQQPVMSVNLTAEKSASSTRGAGMSLSTGRWNFLPRDCVSS